MISAAGYHPRVGNDQDRGDGPPRPAAPAAPEGAAARPAGGVPSDLGGRQPLRIDDLSRLTDVSVRNIREYQDRGLLPPPERDGRIALYDNEHVVRLRLISQLLGRGYTLAVIRDLLEAWTGGRDLYDVLGLEEVASRPWGDDVRLDLDRDQLNDLFGGRLSERNIAQLVTTGVLVPQGETFNCSRKKVVETVPILVAAGIPMDAALEVLVQIRRHMDAVADEMVGLVVGALLPEGIPQGLPEGADVALLTASVERLRAVADVVAAGIFGLAMTRAVDGAIQLVTSRALRDS